MIPRAFWLSIFLIWSTSSFSPAQTGRQEKPKQEDKPQEVTIEISGRAVDQAGAPVAGARIYLVSTNAIDKELGKTLTNGEGKYVFRNVRLPIKHFSHPGVHPSGAFQIYGEAKGFGFAWHGMRFFRPTPRPKDGGTSATPDTYFQDDSIDIDLVFGPAAELTGLVKDEKDKPIAGAVLHLSGMDYLKTEDKEFHPNFREFWVQRLAPPHFRQVQCDEKGQFSFKGLPAETVAYAAIQHPDFATQTFFAAVTAKPITSYEFIANSSVSIVAGVQVRKPIWEARTVRSGPLEIMLVSTRSMKIQVINDDNGASAANVHVFAQSENGASGYGTTDKEGRVELKLPPDEYRFTADPPRDSDYIRTEGQFTITSGAAAQSTAIRLMAGCVLVFEAIDAVDGSPIEGVGFWCEGSDRDSRTGVQSSTSYVDRPVTNAKGQMRAVVPPGSRKYGAGFTIIPGGYQGDPNGVEINCESGKTIDVQFKLKKK